MKRERERERCTYIFVHDILQARRALSRPHLGPKAPPSAVIVVAVVVVVTIYYYCYYYYYYFMFIS